jgi:serine phosphatase RsbU (regulator of sigma subunit)
MSLQEACMLPLANQLQRKPATILFMETRPNKKNELNGPGDRSQQPAGGWRLKCGVALFVLSIAVPLIGVGAALFMVLFRSLLRANIQQCFNEEICSGALPGDRIVEAVRKTNNYIATNHAEASMFATVFIAVLQQDKGEVWYVNSGHDPPLLVRTNGHSERLMPTNPAIGMFPDLDLASKCIKLQNGDSLIAFTDGVSDARSVDGNIFGEKRLLKILGEKSSLKHRLDHLTTELVCHTSGAEQYDDITCIAFSRS